VRVPPDYIRRFSKQRTELPNITDSDVIGAFLAGTTCRDLVSKLGRKPQGRPSEDAPEASTQRGAKKKGRKKSQAKRDAADADLVAAAEYKNPRKPPGGANLFDKMLKEPCPYHQGPVKHTLEECVMLRRHFHRAGPPAEGGRARDDDKKEDHQAGEFPEVRDCFMIYGGHAANASGSCASICPPSEQALCPSTGSFLGSASSPSDDSTFSSASERPPTSEGRP
jgi:hypothetical protein